MRSNPIPRVNRLYAQADTSPGKPCVNRNNPHGHSKECPCGWARASQIVPYVEEFPESPYADLEDMDDPEHRAARFESDRLDAQVDQMREEKHFDH